MSGHFPVFRVENESPKPYALRVHFMRHKTKSRFYTVKSNRSSHIRRRSHTAEVSSNSDKEDISRSSQHYGCNESSVWSDSQRFKCVLSESLGCLVFQHTRVFSILWFMLLLTVLMISSHVSQESWSTFAIFWSFCTGQIPVRSEPLLPPPSCHPVAHVQNTQVSGSSSVPKTSRVSLNIVGRLGQYRIEAATADQLAPIMGQTFDDERQAEMQQNMWNFQQMMMTMNPTLMNSPCSCLSVYQPCRGPQTDTSGPEPCVFSAGTSSTVGHSTSGPGPSQCDPGWNIVSPHDWWIQSLWGGWPT